MRAWSKQQAHQPHMWMILITALALGALFLGETWAIRQSTVEAGSVLEPVFSLPGGYYERDIRLKISPPHPNAEVIFTVDGSIPTPSNGTVYTQPVRLSTASPAVTVVRARVSMPGTRLGPVVSASYFVGVPATLPMMSLVIDPEDLWGSEHGMYANSRQRGREWERPVDVTYVDKDHRSGFHIPAGVRLHGEASRSFEKMPLRLYFRQEYGASRLEYPLFAGNPVRSFKRLVLHSGGQDWQFFPSMNWTLIRNRLTANLALQLDGCAAHSQPVLLFINGEPWGIYQIRERIDQHFLADHYGVESADLLEDPQWLGNQAVLMGDSDHWERVLEFVESHDLADPANYAYIQTQVDLANFIDYHILQIYAANIDWPFHNVQQFRPRVQGGRWHWIVWDTDQGFGAYPSSVHANLMSRVLDDSHPDTGGRDTLLLRKLLENPAFFERFLSRTADVLNSTLAPSSVVVQIDEMAAELEPDIAYETLRWSGTVDWTTSVQEMRDFARQRPDVVRQHMVEAFDLKGTAQLSFNPPTSGSGGVAVNGILVPDLPWQGIYFYGRSIQVVAAPAPGFRFAGWDPPSLPQTAEFTLTLDGGQTITPRFEPLDDDAPQPGDVVFTGYQVDVETASGGDGFTLLVNRPGGVDLRGWRVTDNDTKTATDEGSLIFTDNPAFTHVPQGTTIVVTVTQRSSLPGQAGDIHLPQDDLNAWDRRMVLYSGNGNLDTGADPGFNLGAHDNLVLLAPGPTELFDDDIGIAFVAWGSSVTPASFGVLVDGVRSAPVTDRSQPGGQALDRFLPWLAVLAGLVAMPFTVRWATREGSPQRHKHTKGHEGLP